MSDADFDVGDDGVEVEALGVVVDLVVVDPDGEHASMSGFESDSIDVPPDDCWVTLRNVDESRLDC
jgi:hypothetical protein